MRQFGLIGNPLTHSWSAAYFAGKFRREEISDCRYDLFPLDHLEKLPDLISAQPFLCGLNVTLPYKTHVIRYMNEMDETASFAGAVNCIKITRHSGRPLLKGFNTDAEAFWQSLKEFTDHPDLKAMLLGNGGAARAVEYVFRREKVPFIKVCRKPAEDCVMYEQVNEAMMQEHTLIVNATSCGMFPDVNHCPSIPYEFLNQNHYLFDLIYNPVETEFLRRGALVRAKTCNGLRMLQLQAEKSWEIWNEK